MLGFLVKQIYRFSYFHGHVIHSCMSGCKNRSHRSNLGEKKVKNDVYRFWHLQSACDIASVVLRDLDLFFKVKYFECDYLENGES